MAGLVKAAEGLGGALKRAWELAKGLDQPAELEKLGGVFQQLSNQNPGYFVTGAELPRGLTATDSAEFLNRKHASRTFQPNLTVGRHESTMLPQVRGGPRGEAKLNDTGTRLGEEYEARQLVRGGRGGMNASSDVYDIDTMSLGTNAAAKQLYPALWEYVMSRADGVNLPQALSPSNAFRRNANMAGLYEKHGELANRIVLHPDQLNDQMFTNPSASNMFHKLSSQGQIGALNAAVAQGAGGEVARTGRQLLEGLSEDRAGALGRYLDQGRTLGIEPGAPWKPTTNVAPGHLTDVAKWLWEANNAMGTPSLTGESSLRRAAITSDALQGLQAKDLANRPDLTNRLGRAHGGSVPRA